MGVVNTYEGKGPRPSRPRQNDIVKVGFVCTTVNPEKRQREEGLDLPNKLSVSDFNWWLLLCLVGSRLEAGRTGRRALLYLGSQRQQEWWRLEGTRVPVVRKRHTALRTKDETAPQRRRGGRKTNDLNKVKVTRTEKGKNSRELAGRKECHACILCSRARIWAGHGKDARGMRTSRQITY